MLAGALAKLAFFAACMVLFYSGRLMPGGALYGALVDAGLAILFVISFARLAADAAAWSAEQDGPRRQP
jgi:multisubunit Na+/H+ antiporter MnhB subunit